MNSSPRTWSSLAIVLFCSFFSFPLLAANAPSNLVATATSSSQINLTWSDNSNDETGFTFAFDTTSAMTNPTYVYAGGVNTTSYSHTGRSGATTYFYKIKAEGNPDSTWTSVKSATTAPSSLGASAASSSQINLSWTANAGNSNIVGYTFMYATNSGFSGAAYKYVNGNSTASYSHTGLYAGTTYYYRIKAEGTSDAYDSPFTSAVSASTTSAAPAAPSNLAASVFSTTQINLSWTDNSNNETAFELKRATDSGFTQNVVWIGGIQGSTYSNTGLTPATTYYYKVRAKGSTQDSAYSSAVSATTSSSGTIPTAPSGLTGTSPAPTQVNLSWTDNSNNETGFEVKRATDSGFTQNVVWIGGIQGSTYNNTGLTANTTYYYKVRAEGTAGKSAYSSTFSITTGTGSVQGGTPISPRLYGINAWMPNQIGHVTRGGHLAEHWPEIQASGVQIMRYGGHSVDEDADPTFPETMDQYVDIVDAMRANGIEPILQVPMDAWSFSASQAADIVYHVNVTNGRNVKYWSIGNEPDLASGDYQYTTAEQVANYLKPFASAMKAVDPSIKIIGPDTAWYNEDIIEGLTTPGGDWDITGKDAYNRYYIDVISFHYYRGDGYQNRSNVISALMEFDGFNDDLAALKIRLANCNSAHGRTGSNALTMAVTEANVNWQNPVSSLSGSDATSFLGGQFWAEILGVSAQQGVDFVTFWSVIEGNQLGYLGSTGTKRPSYYHFQMMAQNFRGNSIGVVDNQGDVKTFAAKDLDQVAVLIMNESNTTDMAYSVRLDNINPSATLTVKVDAGITATPSTGTIYRESTIMLIFDTSGNLKKKIEYKLNGHANVGAAPSVTTYP